MEILVTNDDGYRAKGIKVLTEIMRQFGRVTVIAPKHHQSGMSMAASLGLKQIAYKKLSSEEIERDTYTLPRHASGEARIPGTDGGQGMTEPAEWSYLDATPASCVKFGFNTCFLDRMPDVVVSGINHGSNATTASCYSGTLGAAAEAALNGVPAIGVSLETLDPDADFSAVEKYFPGIFRMLTDNPPAKKGIYYNINFPDIPAGKINGIRAAHQGNGRWVKEFIPWNPGIYSRYGITPEMLGQSSTPSAEEGEILYMMAGEYEDDPGNIHGADHWFTRDGYISIVAHNIDTTDYGEVSRLKRLGLDTDFPMTAASSH